MVTTDAVQRIKRGLVQYAKDCSPFIQFFPFYNIYTKFQFLILFRFYDNSNILPQYVSPLRFYLLREQLIDKQFHTSVQQTQQTQQTVNFLISLRKIYIQPNLLQCILYR